MHPSKARQDNDWFGERIEPAIIFPPKCTNFCEMGRVCKSNDRYKRVSIVVFDSEGFIHTRFFGNSTSLIVLRIIKAFKKCFHAHKLLATWQIWSRNYTRIMPTNCTQTGGVRFNWKLVSADGNYGANVRSIGWTQSESWLSMLPKILNIRCVMKYFPKRSNEIYRRSKFR